MSKSRRMLTLLVSLLLMISLLSCASTQKSSSTGEYFDDTVITTKVKALLVKDTALKSFQIGVETYKGVVQLSGFVDTEKTRNQADFVARTVQGVKSVKNNLILK
jgi:osmotically-inducible protein OsmY